MQNGRTPGPLRSRPGTPGLFSIAALVGAVALGGCAPTGSATTAAPTPEPSTAGHPGLGQTFVSTIGGYSIRYPDSDSVSPATQPIAAGAHTWGDDPWVDQFLSSGSEGQMAIVSAPLPPGVTAAQWTRDQLDDAFLSGTAFPACGPKQETALVVVDGVSGVIDTHCAGAILTAIVITGGRAYVVDLHGDPPDQSWFREILATMHLDPAAAVSPAPPADSSPATSPVPAASSPASATP